MFLVRLTKGCLAFLLCHLLLTGEWGEVNPISTLARNYFSGNLAQAQTVALTASIVQLPSLPSSAGSLPPSGVARVGLLEATMLHLDGRELFKIASPAVFERGSPGAQVPVEVRAGQIEANLNRLINVDEFQEAENTRTYVTALDPETTEVLIEVINEQPVLLAKDQYSTTPSVVMTVTDADAQYYSVTKEVLAERWQQILQTELPQALRDRQPEVFNYQVKLVIGILVGTLISSFLLIGLWRFLGWRRTVLEKHYESQQTAALMAASLAKDHGNEGRRLEIRSILQQEFTLERRIQLVIFLRWFVFWALVFTWIAGISASLYRFPQTRQFALGLASTPILLLITWFISGLLNRTLNLLIDRFAKAWDTNEVNSLENLQRRSQRISTTTRVIKGLKTASIYTIAFLWALQLLDIASASILAFGALFALAISFASQSLVKDFVNGFLILLEDQFAIGDYIAVGSVSGLVENLNLRITQLRTDDGRLVTIPNSSIVQVENWTRTWSRADFRVDVAYCEDVDQVLEIVDRVAQDMAEDPYWGKFIIDPKEILGVDSLSHEGIGIRIWLRTQPLKHWLVTRELRRRLKPAFDQAGIQIGIPQRQLTGNLLGRDQTNGLGFEDHLPKANR
ncbi:MAG: mechanosensitive ion channel family protein [Oscillatoriales cyanobacterium SM2_3_0]|nr:mechanosensitive ion channel family protein [Oscillatoriales cyanobacterium SM2_3_0]